MGGASHGLSMKKLVFRVRARQRMIERRIDDDAVRQVVESGETIARYDHDVPYPSRLVLGYAEARPIHIVVADNDSEDLPIVITVYEPDSREWEPGYRRRKRE